MPFIILTAEDQPLKDHDGVMIVLESEADARLWLKPGERVAEIWPPGEPRPSSQPALPESPCGPPR